MEKIKTIGSCYMAASGLAPDKQVGSQHLFSSIQLNNTSTCQRRSPKRFHIFLFRLCHTHAHAHALTFTHSQGRRYEWNHISELVLFALAMQETLKEINRHTCKNFQLRVGKWLTHACTHTHSLSSSLLHNFHIIQFSKKN